MNSRDEGTKGAECCALGDANAENVEVGGPMVDECGAEGGEAAETNRVSAKTTVPSGGKRVVSPDMSVAKAGPRGLVACGRRA